MRDLGGVGHQEVHEGGVEQLSGVVVDHPFVQGSAYSLSDATVNLSLHDHRVDHPAAVVDHAVAQDRDLSGLRVGLDDRGVHAVGERRPCWRVVALPLQPRLLPLGNRWLGEVHIAAADELRCGLCGLVEGVAQRVGQHGHRRQCHHGLRIALDPHDALHDLQVARVHLHRLAGDAQGLLANVTGCQRDRVATHHGRTRGESAHGIGEPARVTCRDEDVVDRHTELIGDDLGEHGLVSLPLAGQAGGDVDPAAGLDLDMAPLVGTDARSLYVATDPEPHPATLRLGLGAVGREVIPAHQSLELGQTGREVAGVVDEGPPVLEEQAVVVGHVLDLDEVGAAHIGAIQPEVVRDGVHGAFHRIDTLRPTGPPIGRDDDGVGVHREELAPVGAGFVRPEKLGGGDDRDDDPVWRVRAVVVPELHRETEHPSGVIEPDLDLLKLCPLVSRGDEVLATVLDPLDLCIEPARCPRDQHLLRPRMHDLDPETTTHVGGDALNLGQRHTELGGDGRTDARGRLRRGEEPDALLVTVPARVDTLALHRHRRAALDPQRQGDPVRGRGNGSRGVANLLHQVCRDVARRLRMHQRFGGPRGLQTDHHGKLLIGDSHALARVLGNIAVGRDHHDNCLTHMFDHLACQGVAGHRVGQVGVRDQQRQAFAGLPVKVLVGVDRDDPRDLDRVHHVDIQDARVRVRTADEGSGQRALPEVVQIATVAGHQTQVLLSLDRGTEHPGGHPPAPRSRTISAARSTDLTMFWYPVQRQRLPEIASLASASVGSGFSRRYAVMVVRKPGVQNPHCSPWHSMKACCTGLIVVVVAFVVVFVPVKVAVPLSVASTRAANPSTVVISSSWAVTANIRHESIGAPSTRTVQAPQTPCSHPT